MDTALEQVKALLEQKYRQYDQPAFIENDPVSIPHEFSRKEDIEISGFLTAVLSWGQRQTIIRNSRSLMALMDHSPFEFTRDAGRDDIRLLQNFRHRTFNGTDLDYFIRALRDIYHNQGGLEGLFTASRPFHPANSISSFRAAFLCIPHEKRSEKHLSDPRKGSPAKRINMFLRWMVRKDSNGVDFGIWDSIPQSGLACPLDVHSAATARKLGLITRSQADNKALDELMGHLRSFDHDDPVKYDYALFGLSIFEKF